MINLTIGAKVKLLTSIYDGEDHHPPSWIAYTGEVLIVKRVFDGGLAVAHEGNTGAFLIYNREYEAVPVI